MAAESGRIGDLHKYRDADEAKSSAENSKSLFKNYSGSAYPSHAFRRQDSGVERKALSLPIEQVLPLAANLRESPDTESEVTDSETKLINSGTRLKDIETRLTDPGTRLTDSETRLTDTESSRLAQLRFNMNPVESKGRMVRFTSPNQRSDSIGVDEAELGTFGDLPVYPVKFSKSRRHTLANVR